jgi:hypothetical protein
MRRAALRGAVSVVLAGVLLASAPGNAQSPNPNSTQNVAPSASGQSAATVEARRKALFARMLERPDDLDTAFEYAALSAQLGDLESAISTLERMLIFAPGLPRLQFELGVLYYRLGAYETANTYFQAVEGAADVPPEVQAQVASYLTATERRAKGSNFGGFVMTGVRYQSNANAGPGSATITLNGFNFTLNPGAVGQPDLNGFVLGNVNASVDMPGQGDTFGLSVTGYGSLYRNQTQINTGVVQLRAGPEFDLGRFHIDNARAGVYGVFTGAALGGAPYLSAAGLGTSLTFAPDARSQLRIRGEGQWQQYFNSALRPTSALRSGVDVSGSVTYSYKLTPALDVFAGASFDRHHGGRGYLKNWVTGLQAGASYSFASPIAALEAPWRVGVTASAQYLVADAPDPVFSPTDPEHTTTLSLEGRLTVPLPNAFSVEASAGYTRALSNYALSAYSNVWVSLGIGKSF